MMSKGPQIPQDRAPVTTIQNYENAAVRGPTVCLPAAQVSFQKKLKNVFQYKLPGSEGSFVKVATLRSANKPATHICARACC